MREQGIEVPTRGSIQDIGPTVSHKTKIIELYLKEYEYTDIEQRTRHTGDAIKRYINEVIQEYLSLYETYKEMGADRIAQIMTVSSPDLDRKKGGWGVSP